MARRKPQISLSSADEIRDKITARQIKQIQNMFLKLAKEAREKAKKLEGRYNISSIIQRKYLEDLAKELEHQMKADFANLKNNIEQDMRQVSEGVIDCIKEYEESIGMPISNAWLSVPVDAIEAVSSGKLYAGNWTLSSRIWGIERKAIKDIHTVIAEGIAANRSAYDIAKDLEKYVDPKAKKDWNWSKVYPGTNRKIDYSAQRLARTMVSHAYQFSFVESTKDNPYIAKYKWISSHDKRVCKICKERDGKLFDKDKLPLDHPNGRCTFISVFEKSAMQISDEMAAWVKGKEGDFPKIDAYMKKRFGVERYDKAIQMAQQAMKREVPVGYDNNGGIDFESAYKEMVGEMSRGQMRNVLLGKGVDFDSVASMSVEELEENVIKILIDERKESIKRMFDLQSAYKNIKIDDIDKIKEIFSSEIPSSLNYGSTFQKFVYSTGIGNGKPKVVDKLPDGLTRLFRGVKDSALLGSFINDLIKYDDMSYMGNGIFGDGIYMTTSSGAAKTYGDNVMSAVISADAKIVDYDVVYKEMMEDGFGIKVGQGDVSTYALLKGYDVIYQKVDRFEKGEIYYNIINREVLIVER